MQPNYEKITDRRVEIERGPGGVYEARISGANLSFTGEILNIGGRASAFPPGNTLEFGGGKTEVVIRGYDDSRADDGKLLAIGFANAPEPVCL